MTVKHPNPEAELMRVLSCIEDRMNNKDLNEHDAQILFKIAEYLCRMVESKNLTLEI